MKNDLDADRTRRWLRPTEPSTNANHARTLRHGGTGSWLLDHPAFQAWLSGQTPCRHIWLKGFAGCGKTVLSTTVLDHFANAKEQSEILLRFYFDFSDTTKQTVDGMLRSLVFQVFQSSTTSASHLIALFHRCQKGSQQPSTRALSEVLSKMIEGNERVFVILDALDESSSRREVLSWIKHITSDSMPQVQLLCTGRPEADLLREIPLLIGEAN